MGFRPQDITLQTQFGEVRTGQTFTLETTEAPPPWLIRDRPEPLSDWDWQWGSYNGWAFGHGSPWEINSVDGLADMMELKTQDAQLLGDGEVFGQDWENKRILTVEFSGANILLEHCFQPYEELMTPDRIMDARCACMRRQDDLPLLVNDTWAIMARPRKFVVPQRRGEPPTLTVSWEAQDPSLYSALESSASATLLIEGEGRAYPRPWASPGITPGSWRYQGVQRTGLMWVRNQGCRQTYLRARIEGPVINPILVNQENFQQLGFNLTLEQDEWLEIDMRRGRAMLNGTESRYYTLTERSNWWSCAPGDTPVRFMSGGPATSARAIIYWRSAW